MLRALTILALSTLPAAAQDFFTLKGHGGPIMGIAVSPSGQIATASFDNAVGLWTDQTPLWLDGHEAAVTTTEFFSDEFVLSGSDDFSLRLWSGQGTSRVLGRHEAKIKSLTRCSGGRNLVASASWDWTIGLWDIGPSAGDVVAGKSEGPSRTALRGHDKGVNDIAFSPDCRTLYSASTDGTIRQWDVAAAAEMKILAKQGFGINELVATEDWIAYGAVDGATRILDLSGDEIADFTLDRRPILSMAFNEPTQRLAVGEGEGFIMVIDTENWRIVKDFRATRQGPVWALAFSPDGVNIHAGGIDDVMYSWPVATMDAHDQMGSAARTFLEDPDTLSNGERQFKRKCSICHTLTEDSKRRAGPTLYDVFGRRAGTLPGYIYSDTLDGSDIIWSARTIDRLFDEGPDHYIPGSKMPMQRITKPQDRLDLIEYLARVTQPKGE